jgi:cyclopropane fatty-acyl-phospholipid synthase-like methyltransferase
MQDDLVRSGYDRMAHDYLAQRDQFKNLPHLEELAARLRPGAPVLDVGCGAGVPVARFLAERGFAVTGLDLSPVQVALAREHVPGASFDVCDMRAVQPGAYAVDAVVSFYAIFHTPREQHADILRTLAACLIPRGFLLVTLGADAWEGVEPFHGVEMYWSHYGPEENRTMITSAGLEIIRDVIDTSGDERHHVLLAQKAVT